MHNNLLYQINNQHLREAYNLLHSINNLHQHLRLVRNHRQQINQYHLLLLEQATKVSTRIRRTPKRLSDYIIEFDKNIIYLDYIYFRIIIFVKG